MSSLKIISSMAFLCVWAFLPAQNLDNKIKELSVSSPSAASFNKFTDIPVDIYTGVPSIQIPIYELTEGPIKVPLTLNYHSNGVQVDDIPSWVGMGWTLNYGGSLTRSVQSLPDDISSGYWGNGATFDPTNPGHLSNVYNGGRDSEPDIFAYNVGGYSGKFIFDADQKPILFPVQDIKIVVVGNMTGFKLITPEGLIYTFNTREISNSLNATYNTYTQWMLDRIDSPDGKYFIQYTYVDENYYQVFRNFTYYLNYSITSSSGICPGSSLMPQSSGPGYDMSTKRLSTIATSTATINFRANTAREDIPSCKRLDSININTGSYCKNFLLSYDYTKVIASSTTADEKRLKLNSVRQKSCDQTTEVPPYSFEYEGSLNTDGSLKMPKYMSKSIDHWGFFNNENNDGCQVLTPYTEAIYPNGNVVSYGTAKRSANASGKAGLIKKITYPESGSTSLVYENNTYFGETTGTPSTLLALNKSCITQNCCDFQDQTGYYTFPAGTNFNEIHLEFKGNRWSNCMDPSNYILAIYNNINTLVGSFSFNLSGNSQSATIKKKLSQIATLTTGINYKFVMTLEMMSGSFDLIKIPIIFTNINSAGYRIKEVRTHDGINTANDIIKTYSYNKPGTTESSGLLRSPLLYSKIDPGSTKYTLTGTYTQTYFLFLGNSFYQGSSLDGVLHGYTNVNVAESNNGSTQYTFKNVVNTLNPQGNIPAMSIYLNEWNGKNLRTESKNQSNATLLDVQQTYIPRLNYFGTGKYMKVLNLASCSANGFPLQIDNIYTGDVLTKRYALDTLREQLDGVQKITKFTYDATHRFTPPISKSYVNSDGKTQLEEYTYNHDYSITAFRDSLIKKNIIAIPFKTKSYVNAVQVDGTETEYGWYSLSTGAYQTGSSAAFPRLYKQFRDEYTWNASSTLTGANKVLQRTFDNYDIKGNIASITPFGWTPTLFEWNSNGTLKKQTFASHIKQYAYIPGTRMISSITDIDGQVVTYQYDKLSRLNKTLERSSNVVTDISYNYKTVSDPNNWIKVKKTYTPVSGSNVNIIEVIQYFDGIGRPLQTVKKNQANGIKDLVVDAVAYDNKGRIIKKYLPFQSAVSTGAMQAIPSGQGFTQIDYEPSPLHRTSVETPPSWYATTTSYGSNVANEVKLTYGASPTYYAAGLLAKETMTDASNRVTVTYKDKKGRTILSKNTKVGATASEVADTYTVYDDKDRIKTIFPPETNTSSTGLVFDYRYDQGDNVIYKKVADQDAVHMVYSDMDLMTFYKDGNLGSATYNENGLADQWMMTKYDIYGRPISKGFYTSATTPLGNNAATAFTKQISWLTYGTSGIELGKMKTNDQLILGNYTNTTTKILETYNYDSYGRMTSKIGNNHYNTVSGNQLSYFTYDFLDNVIRDSTVQIVQDGTHKYVTRQAYDYLGRPMHTYHRIVTGAIDNGEKHIATQNYNFRGEVVSKLLSSGYYSGPPTPGQTYLQKIDYTYNAQGWLTSINDPFLTGSVDPLNADYSDVFRLNLGYDTAPTSVTGLTPALDKSGNISQMTWQNRGQDIMGYNFDYNYLGQVLNAKNFDVVSPATTGTYNQRYNENLTYDNRGNILSLYRNTINGASMLNIDNLTYSYQVGTNRINTIADATSNAQGFNTNGATAGYTYDNNGNCYTDPYKKITATKYFFNNLPKDITVNQGVGNDGKIRFTYDADGRKLRKQVLNNANAVTYQQDYIGKAEYVGVIPNIEAIYHPEGRAVWNGTTWRYEFNVTDHLGNVRAVISDLNNNKILTITTSQTINEIINVNAYYPFGLLMAGTFSNNTTTPDTKYQYNGKEMNTDLGLNLSDYGARWYDACIGRFTSVDPLADHPNQVDNSPYAAMWNNPIKYNDPDGRCPICPFIIIAFLMLESQPASTPGSDKDHVTIKQAQDDYNKSQLFSLIPGAKQTKTSQVVAGRVINEIKSEVKEEVTTRAARREVMRDEKIPTSQQPKSQSKNESGYEYSYEVPRAGGGKETKSVQQQTKDGSHEGVEHWEAGSVKTDPRTGEIRMTDHGRPKLQNSKSKVNVKAKESGGDGSW